MVGAETGDSLIASLDGKILYPSAHRSHVTYTQHGVTVTDPYRWMEDLDSQETKAFIETQNKITDELMSKFQDRQKFKDRLTELFNFERFGSPSKHGDYYYYFHNSGLQPHNIFYQQDSIKSEPRVFLDPNALETDGTASLKTYSFSRSGKLFAYAISSSGSDWSTIYLKDCNGNKLDDVIEWAKFTQIAFTHDDKGFYYTSYERPDVDAVKAGVETGVNINQRLLYHKIGTPQSEDVLVHLDTEHPRHKMLPAISDDGKYLLLKIMNGGIASMFYVGDLEANDNVIVQGHDWIKLADNFDARHVYLTNDGTLFYFRTNKDAPRYRIVKYDLAKPEEGFIDLIPQSEDVVAGSTVVDGNKLVLISMHDVKDVATVHDLTSGKFLYQIPLPVGTLGNVIGNRESKDFFITFTSYLTPGTIYYYDFGVEEQEKRLAIFREVKIKGFDNTMFETKQIFYQSKDGTKIPMFVTHRKDLVFDGNNPTFLHGYGGFSSSIQAGCSISYIVFMQHFGGVVAVANLRGGGEYGRDWHNAGTVLNKQNVFDDFQYAAKYLINEKYTQPSKLAINGQSNGGLLVAACVNQTPELFGAAVAEVAGLDMLRFHKFTIGHSWQAEYGYPDDNAEEFHNLLKYSPLHNVHKDKPYPAVALFTSDHDDRVVPLHSYKHIAELQYTAGPWTKNPLILRVETKAGHGAGKPLAKRIAETSDKFAFIATAIGATWRD
ncbi:prolyl oligopeptidase [Entomortierella parvispora]|uniref:Prolyl endopeptidase n=1 Tax=Entomortierella parvispora TaxID=205924 RepID=A0A9P3HAD2_9FUNG|nr:prolyl oligopeptidase [Entomortierella parvispora]